MIRTSLSSVPDRRCMIKSCSSTRWSRQCHLITTATTNNATATRPNVTGAGRRRTMPNFSSSHSILPTPAATITAITTTITRPISFHNCNYRSTHRFLSASSSPTFIPSPSSSPPSRRRPPGASISTKPLYDFSQQLHDDNGEEGDDQTRTIHTSRENNPLDFVYDDYSYESIDEDNGDDMPLWGKTIAGRGGSGVRLDNVSKYDNYSQYASPAATATATANGRNTLDGNQFTEESLLELLNNTNHEMQDSTNYTTNTNGDDYYAEESLLQLLNNDNYNQGMALSPSAPQREELPLPAEESLLGLLHKESAAESSSPHSQITHKDTQKELHNLQLQLELESTEEAVLKCLDVWKSARDRSDHGTIPAVRKALMSWYGPLTEAIELEQWLYLNGDNKTSSTLNYATVDEDVDNDADDNDDALAAALAAVSGEGGGGVSPKGVSTKKDTRVKDRTIYGPLLCLLPPQKIAVLLAHSAFSCAVADGDVGSKVVSLAIYIANALETEVNVSRALRVRAIEKSKRSKMMSGVGGAVVDDDDGGFTGGNDDPGVVEDSPQGKFDVGVNSKWENVAVDEWVYTATHLQRFLDELSGSGNPGEKKSLASQGRVKPDMVRKRCQEILYSEGFFPRQGNGSTASTANDVLLQRPISMNEFVDWDPVLKVKLGAALIRLLLDHTTFSNQSKNRRGASLDPAFLYSRRKTSGNMKFSGFITIHPDLLHLALREELSPNSSFISPRTMQNTRCQPMVVPPKKWMDVNDGGYETLKVDFMRTRQCKVQKDAIRNADLSKVFDGLNVLGQIPWKINQHVLDVACKCWDDGIVLGDIPPQVDYEVPPLPDRMEYRDFKTMGEEEQKSQIEAFRKHKDAITKHLRFKQKNMDLHSLRCSAMLKLNQAKKFRDFEEIFFPYNVDFRGRAYPVPPHLSIVGSDLCRALLVFAHPKPLGPNGLYWLKVHLANLAGANKMSFDGRANFADENMDSIRAAVKDPFGENRWWMDFDDPFQGLATCHEIVKAIDSGDPESYMCLLPVHMDGSCNGLQHYAALGRDRVGGKAVNLCVADKPQDVYIGVMHEVIRRVALDADEVIGFDENKSDLTRAEKEQLKKVKSARLVNGLIDRGVVKRTVMTSVYGVTYIGARNQISEKIEEKLEGKGHDIDEMESEINMACGYLASLTMEVMGQLFIGARQTMNWLTACARLISSQGQPVAFISPIGVPVVQPYRQKRPFTVVTLLQNIVLTNDSDTLPLHKTRQVSAFPPNYVHSLDSSHMLLTAIEMQKRGLYFSAVHDSYWTHPCDVEEMNAILRECFIDLYNQPLLGDLKTMWELRYPSITFPDVPARGDLDLEDVRSAPYFFQ